MEIARHIHSVIYMNKQTPAHLISFRQSLRSGRRRQSGRNPTRPFVSDGRTRPGRPFSRRSETGVVSIGALQTDRYSYPDRRKRGLAYYRTVYSVWAKTSHLAPSVVMRALLAETTTRYVDVILPESYGSQNTVQKAKRLLSYLNCGFVCLAVDRVRGQAIHDVDLQLVSKQIRAYSFLFCEWASA